MENIKKKLKYYFPYKIFDVERRSKSQISIVKSASMASLSTPLKITKNIGICNYSKKLKSTVLSSKIFSAYMQNYIGQTQDYSFKSPGNIIYPIRKNYHLLPMKIKRNDSKFEENKTCNENFVGSVLEKPYGYKYKRTRIVINKDNLSQLHRSESEKIRAKIFMNFSEGEHYHKVLMKTFGIKNIDLINCKNIIKDNFDYLKESLNDFNTIENPISEKECEFKIKIKFKDENVLFNMKIFSICLNFYEIIGGKEKIQNKMKNKNKIYLPFKLLPLFYLLDYSDFKNFLSEILYYDVEKDSMNIDNSILNSSVKKYLQYLKNIIITEKNNKYINDISFYKNEFLYQKCFNWIVSDDAESVKKPLYKLKISFPKVIFEKKFDKIKVINHLNKNVLLQVLKKNFVNWDKLILFDLFGNKKFRYIMNNILIGGDKYYKCAIKLYEYDYNNEAKDINGESKNSKSYEFFMSEVIRKESYYYILNPNIILIISGDNNMKFQKLELSIQESKILYEISKFWGVIITLFKCMYKDEMTHKIFFKLNILDDFPKFLCKNPKNNINLKEDSFSKDFNTNNFLEYKTKGLELLVTKCLLKTINITKKDKTCLYYQVPEELYKTILSSNNDMKIINSIKNNFNEIIENENEVNIFKEEEKMIDKLNRKTKNYFDKYKDDKTPNIKYLKSTPIKNFNKMRTQNTKIRPDKIMFNNENLQSLQKKNTILKKNKNTPKDSDKKKSVKATKFMITEKNIPDNINNNNEIIQKHDIKKFQSETKEIIEEDVNEYLTDINNKKEFIKQRLRRQNTINFRKNNPKTFK